MRIAIVSEVITALKAVAEPNFTQKMEGFGINTSKALGVRMPNVRKVAKLTGKNHVLALELWKTEIHEARILAPQIADPKQITNELFDAWVGDFDSWDMCDNACDTLGEVPFAVDKIYEYATDEREYVKRTAFVLMARMAVHNKKADDAFFEQFFPLIEREAYDDRNFVKKAINWALRQIGKRSEDLRKKALEVAYRIEKQDSKAARWIAKDAIRELESEKTIAYIAKHKKMNHDRIS